MSSPAISVIDLPLNTPAILERVEGEPAFVKRLYGLGFFPGCRLWLRRRLGIKGSVVLSLDSTSFSMRREEAARLFARVHNA